MAKNENVKNGVIFPAGPKNDATQSILSVRVIYRDW